MPTTILQTKLFVPPLNPGHIPRQRLLDRLDSGLSTKLTLVTAPPGFGKTSIIGTWVKQSGIPTGWLSLDPRDNDPAQFFSHFIAALQGLQPSLGAQALVELFASQSFSIETLLTDLINEIAGLPGRYRLVLDDFHLIENQTIHLGITFLLEHLPAQLHLVVATRSDPPLPLAKFRARGEINELRVDDLRFGMEEAAAFLQAAIGSGITRSEIEALETRTEGWIAGLQLAVLSMKTHREQSSFIQNFTGSNRYIIDYLVEEVLNQLPAQTRRFLLQTSILDRFCGDLCDAILILDSPEPLPAETKASFTGHTPPARSQELLEQLERNNIFLIPLDSQKHWYRYHHLFGSILRHFLNTQEGHLVSSLHQRASEWFASHGLVDEAIEHACAAKDWRLAAHHISHNSRQLFLHGEFYRLIGWVNRLPAEYRREDARLSLYHAFSLLLAGNIDEAEQVWRPMEKQLISPEETLLSMGKLVLSAFLTYHRGKPLDALPMLDAAIQQLKDEGSDPDEELLCGFACIGLADTQRILGRLDLAEKAYREALPINQRAENLLGMHICYRSLGYILFERAQLQKAIDMYQEGIERSRAWAEREFGRAYDLLPSANLFLGLGEIHYERDDLQQAEGMIDKAVQLFELSGSIHLVGAYHLKALIALAGNDLVGVHEQTQKLNRFAAGIPTSFLYAQPGRFLTDLRLHLAGLALPPDYPVGKAALQDEIEDWVHSVEAFDAGQFLDFHDSQSVVLARSFLFLGRPEKAVALLTPLLEVARANGRQRRILQRLSVLAHAHQRLGDQASALNAIREALTIAEAHGFLRTILDEGQELRPLLQSALQRNITPRFTTRLLSMLSGPEPEGGLKARANRLLIEPLSERELEVLSLVAEGLSNQQIAEKLFVALSTVKKHTGAIFGKLNVDSRTEAIQRARTLGLI